MPRELDELKAFFSRDPNWKKIRGYAIMRRQQALEELADLELPPEMADRVRVAAAVWKEVADMQELLTTEVDNKEVLHAIANMDEPELAAYFADLETGDETDE